MMGFKFGTAINCIDGRTQEVVIDRLLEIQLFPKAGAATLCPAKDVHAKVVILK